MYSLSKAYPKFSFLKQQTAPLFSSVFSNWRLYATKKSKQTKASPSTSSNPRLSLKAAAFAIPKAMESSVFGSMNIQEMFKLEGDSEGMNAGEDAFFITPSQATNSHLVSSVFGVADGVGGWVEYKVDPSEMSRALMNNCKQISSSLLAEPQKEIDPKELLTLSYQNILEAKQVKAGSCTACVAALSKNKLKIANLGDSGVLILRPTSSDSPSNPLYTTAFKTEEMQHSFNTPFQVAVLPESMNGFWCNDHPSEAKVYEFEVQEGDVIICATDGLFDNLFEEQMEKGATTLAATCSEEEFTALLAKWLAFQARIVGANRTCDSPFGKNASLKGYYFRGGKLDDVTVIACKVVKQE